MMKFKRLSKNKTNSLPKTAGVYAFKRGKDFLYIGKAVNIRQRVKNHFQHTSFKDEVFIIPKADKIGYIKTDSEIEALLLEAELIKKHQPRYNTVWKDNKNYSFVEITAEETPRILISHQTKANSRYIGPFVDSKALKITLKTLRRVFPYITKRHRNQMPCLFCQLKLCPGPCTTQQEKKEYRKTINSLIQVLQGKKQRVMRELKTEMKSAALNQEFERAAGLRDQIFALENVFLHSHILEGAKLLPERKELSSFLGAKTKIKRIEGYDVSNIQGKEATGSMVVFENGLSNKAEYRKFKIKIAGKPDDIAMLKEILIRRIRHQEWPLPQLILIDGGIAQLNAAIASKNQRIKSNKIGHMSDFVTKIQGTKIVSLAKRKNELFIEGKKRPVLLKDLPQDISNLVLQIRDEAHRFAISYHKKLRSKEFLKN